MKLSEKQWFKKAKGITLVVLVITVIVMMILSGVAISMISPGGIPFGKMEGIAQQYNSTEEEKNQAMKNLISAIGSDSSNLAGITLDEIYQLIAQLAARVEALENNSGNDELDDIIARLENLENNSNSEEIADLITSFQKLGSCIFILNN